MFASLLVLTVALSAHAPAPPEAARYAERVALLAADARCGLLAPAVREGLAAGAAQARGDLLRAGWSALEADRLAGRAGVEMEARPCAEPTLRDAARRAEAGFKGWSRTHHAHFPGRHAGWTVRRSPDPQGWVLWQELADWPGARFGIIEGPHGAALTFSALNDAAGARLVLRDPARGGATLDVPGRAPTLTLAAAAPSSAMARAFSASARGGRGAFAFPDAALAALAQLDPRETAVLELVGPDGRVSRRTFVEAGDLGAALAFLKARPG